MFDCPNIIIIIINHHNLYLILFSVYQHDDPFSTRLLRQSILAAPPRHRSRPRSTSAAAFTHPDKLEQDQNYQDHPSCVFPTRRTSVCGMSLACWTPARLIGSLVPSLRPSQSSFLVLRPRLFGENVAWTWPQESVSTGFNIDRSQDTVELTTLPVGLLLLMLFKVRKRQASCLRLSGSAETSLNLRIAPIDHVIKEQGRVGNDCTWTYANRT